MVYVYLNNLTNKIMKNLLIIIAVALFIIGEVMCTVKIFTAEKTSNRVIYAISAVTGFGCIVGYFDLD